MYKKDNFRTYRMFVLYFGYVNIGINGLTKQRRLRQNTNLNAVDYLEVAILK